eukprot:3497084-Rhodomonas_salina.1
MERSLTSFNLLGVSNPAVPHSVKKQSARVDPLSHASLPSVERELRKLFNLGQEFQKYSQQKSTEDQTKLARIDSEILARINASRLRQIDLCRCAFQALPTSPEPVYPLRDSVRRALRNYKKYAVDFISRGLNGVFRVVKTRKTREPNGFNAAYFFCEHLYAVSVFLFSCEESHGKPSTQSTNCFTSFATEAFRQNQLQTKRSEWLKILEDTFTSLDDNSDLLHDPSSILLKEQLVLIRRMLFAVNTDSADKAYLLCEVAAVAVGAARYALTGVSDISSHLRGIVKHGARVFSRHSVRDITRKVLLIETYRMDEGLATVTAEQGSLAKFKQKLRTIQSETMSTRLSSTHWEILVAWVDFLASFLLLGSSSRRAPLPPTLVQWIVRGDVPGKDGDWDSVVQGKLIGLHHLTALRDNKWELQRASAMINASGALEGMNVSSALGDFLDKMLQEEQSPIAVICHRSAKSLAVTSQDPSGWLLLLVEHEMLTNPQSTSEPDVENKIIGDADRLE